MWSLALVCWVGLVLGCGKRDAPPAVATVPQPPSPEDVAEQHLASLRSELIALKTNKQDAAVLVRLRSEVTNSVLSPLKGVVFSWWMQEMALQGMTNEARSAYLDVVGRDDERARGGFGVVERLYLRSESWSELLAWERALLNKDLPDDLVPQAWMLVMRAQDGLGRLGDVVAEVPAVVKAMPEADAERVVGSAFRMALDGGQYALAGKILDAVVTAGADKGGLKRFVRVSRVDLMLASGRLAEAEAGLWIEAAELSDGELAPRASRLMAAWRAADQENAATAFATRALEQWGERPLSRGEVGAAWVRAAVKDKNPDAFIARLDACVKANVGADALVPPFQDGFYAVLSSGTEAQKRQCLEMASRLQALPAGQESDVAQLKLMRVDGAFLMNDFQTAQDIVMSGIPGHDAEWQSVLTNKIAAHRALAENRPEDAIRCFRAHMEKVKAWESPELNPENGLAMHKEAVLGFNEKRIGDVYAGMGRTDDAAACYARARAYYEEALKTVARDSKEYASYEQEMKEVPAAQ
jgi:tetratricopeptide (TPR) repeat protein